MNGTDDTDQAGIVDDGGELDPRQAAALIEQTEIIMLIAAGSTFFGPKGAWGLTGLGCAIALLVYAAVLTAWLRRPAVRS